MTEEMDETEYVKKVIEAAEVYKEVIEEDIEDLSELLIDVEVADEEEWVDNFYQICAFAALLGNDERWYNKIYDNEIDETFSYTYEMANEVDTLIQLMMEDGDWSDSDSLLIAFKQFHAAMKKEYNMVEVADSEDRNVDSVAMLNRMHGGIKKLRKKLYTMNETLNEVINEGYEMLADDIEDDDYDEMNESIAAVDEAIANVSSVLHELIDYLS